MAGSIGEVKDSNDKAKVPRDNPCGNELQRSQTLDNGDVMTADDPSRHNPETPRRQFSFISLAGIGLVVGNTWPALGGSILTSIYNGGAPGVLYEFIAASLCYFTIAATLSELASALPSSSGVYLWASVTPGEKRGRMLGYFAGWWNCLAWTLAAASMSFIASEHVFICFLIITWLACGIVCLWNSIVPHLNVAGMALIILGALATIAVCAAKTRTGPGSASNKTVWKDWSADIGYPDGFVFIAGMLNASYAMGAADAVSHLAEEIPDPAKNVPRAIGMQYLLGFVTGFAYLVAILYAITDYDAVFASGFPIGEIYAQATRRSAGAIGLLVLILLPTLLSTVGCFVTCGRTLWTLARDGAAPFPAALGRIHPGFGVPLAATLTTGVFVMLLGVIYLGSSTAFNAFVGTYVLLSTASYMAATLPYVVRRRDPGFARGAFYMRGLFGWVVVAWASLYMPVWFVVYCFPYALPTDAQSMNYSVLIWGGLTIFVAIWWVVVARHRCVKPTPRITW